MNGHSELKSKPRVIVVTPVKNESSIIGRFLACCSMFADKIILLDQNSTDDTLSIAKQFPKVEIHVNSDSRYDEQGRQKRLLELARTAGGKNPVILALDADEIPTATILNSPEWISVLQSPPGTVLRMSRLEILPGCQQVLVHDRWPFGYVDDGAEHSGELFHSIRVPMPPNRNEIITSQIKVLHYSFVRAELQAAKNRFYCIKENLNSFRSLMERRALYRYDFIENRVKTMKAEAFSHSWIAGYEAQGIDMTSTFVEIPNWFDQEAGESVLKSGGARFHFDPVWNMNYQAGKVADKTFCLPPKGLGRALALLDKFYASFPLKRPFAAAMDGVLKTYIYCRGS